MESNLVQAEYVKDNHVLVGAIQPNMILAALLGAEFSFFNDKDADVRGKPLENISAKQELPPLDSILKHQLVKDLGRQIENISNEHPELRVIPPFFWEGSYGSVLIGMAPLLLF
jgi:hypothetical protein